METRHLINDPPPPGARMHLFTVYGHPIVGVRQTVPCRANAKVYIADPTDPGPEPEFEGESKMYWDAQESELDGEWGRIYEDPAGDTWTRNQLWWLPEGEEPG